MKHFLMQASASRARSKANTATGMYIIVHEDCDLDLRQCYLTMEA